MPFTDEMARRLTRDLLSVTKSDDPKDYDWVKDLPEAPEIEEGVTVVVPGRPRPRRRGLKSGRSTKRGR